VVSEGEKREMMANPKPAPEDQDAFADRRVYARVPVALPASLQADAERHSVQLVDVSAGGAKLKCAARIAVGTAVTLDCGSLARTAVVRWQNGGLMGLMFDSELDSRVVSAMTERSRALEALMQTRE
jgi:c-di-GMP-binding flagellar brake protein YcgR